MTVFECPLCCAENFSDIISLENHLLDLCDNIICPLCELQFKTIRTLAMHLGRGCRSEGNDKEALLDFNSGTCERQVIKNLNSLSEKPVRSRAYESDDSTEKTTLRDIKISEGCLTNKPNDGSNHVEMHDDLKKNDDVKYCDNLYMCSVCNITFTSVEDHLNKFHQDENVLVDALSETSSALERKEIVEETRISEQEGAFASDLLSKETDSELWSNDEVNSLLIVNWEASGCLEDKMNNSKSSKMLLSKDSTGIQKCQWIPYKNYFYFCSSSEMRTEEIIIKKNLVDSENSNCWPKSLQKYPMATFVIVNDDVCLDEFETVICENKPYIFNGHRVRVLKVKGRDGVPCLEDIPFPEEPPDTIVPVLKLNRAQPNDLVDSYAVMWPCHLCGTLTYHWSDLAKHSCSSSSKYFPCTLCKKTFYSRRSLNNHFSIYHKIARSSSGSLPCSLCPAKVQTASHLEKHLAMHKKNDLIKCDICESMVQKITYSDHLKAHGKNGSLSLVCPLCNRPFKGQSELSLHIPQCHLQTNREDNLKCIICRMSFSDLNTVREHMVSHDIPIKPHLCSYCPKSYYRLIDKVIHERVHTKSKPHSCSECGRCFRLRHSLVAHMRIHTGERPFKCSICDKTFRTKHLQRSHVATHNGQQPFKCKHCNKHFRTKEKLDLHEKSHKKPFVCVNCKRIFYSLSFAKKHLENHKNNQLSFTCNMCPNMFTRAAYLESHLRNHHGLDAPTSISISTQKTYEQMEESVYN